MLARHAPTRRALLGLALATTGLVVGSASVLAGDGDDRAPLHTSERHAPHVERHVRHDDVVLDRYRALRRIDHLLDGIDDVAEATRTPWRRGFGPLRLERTVGTGAEVPRRVDDARGPRFAGEDPRERPGAQPAELTQRGRHGDAFRGPGDVENGLYELRLEVLRLREQIAEAPSVRRAPVIAPMSDREFHAFVTAVRRARFVDDKIAVVQDSAIHVHVTSEQAAQIVGEVPSWGQVDVAFALHGRLVDPQGAHRIYDAITFSSDREALRRRLRYGH